MNDLRSNTVPFTRRDLLGRAGSGAGLLALATLLADEGLLADSPSPGLGGRALAPLAPAQPHAAARAKSVIWIFTNGGPSQVDTWDYKPELARRHGQTLDGFDPKTGFFQGAVGPIMRSPFEFTPRGACGKHVASIFPHLGEHVDRMAFVHSGYTESNNHSPALFMMNTGMPRMGFPCLGSWVSYGLGSESRDLPSFVVMSDPLGRGLPKGHAGNWNSGFLPSVYQGTHLRPKGEPIRNLSRIARSNGVQRAQLDLLVRLERQRQRAEQNARPRDREIDARIENFELAYRMQSTAPEVFDVEREPAHIQQLYGTGQKHCGPFARQCLLARRLVERGVRFVQIYSGGNENQRSWDGHQDIRGNHTQFAGETDQPVAALISDLAQRGLLDETLIVWGGEFGRLPLTQKGNKPGRDHNPHAFTTWMCGGGVKGGVSYGETDELGLRAEVDKVSVNDLHATVLHLIGVDHERLTYRHNGRNFRLTDVAGRVIEDVLA